MQSVLPLIKSWGLIALISASRHAQMLHLTVLTSTSPHAHTHGKRRSIETGSNQMSAETLAILFLRLNTADAKISRGHNTNEILIYTAIFHRKNRLHNSLTLQSLHHHTQTIPQVVSNSIYFLVTFLLCTLCTSCQLS